VADASRELQQRLLEDPQARARFLADILDLLRESGVDTSSREFEETFASALDLTDGDRFMAGLAANAIVIVSASAGQRPRGGDGQQELAGVGNVASSVVIVAASAGQRGLGQRLGDAASSVVIVAASAGQRGLGGFELQPGQQVTVDIPPAMKMAEVAGVLRELATQLESESAALDDQIKTLATQLKQTGLAHDMEDNTQAGEGPPADRG
jgi:hypothetical protein